MTAPNASTGSPADSFRLLTQDLTSELTLGLLHEVNNVLTGVNFQIDGCLDQLAPDHPLSPPLSELVEAVAKINRLLDRTSQINLPVNEEEGPCYHDLEVLIGWQLDLLRIILPRRLPILISPPKSPIHVELNELDLRTLLLQIANTFRHHPAPDQARALLEIKTGTELDLAALLPSANPSETAGILFRVIGPAAKETHSLAGQALGPTPADLILAQQLAIRMGGNLLNLSGNESPFPDLALLLPKVNLVD